MAKKKRSSGGFQGKGESKRATAKKVARKQSRANRILSVGMVAIVLGLVIAGMVRVFGSGDSTGSAVAFDTSGAEVVSLEEGASRESVAHQATDRETRYLGPDNNPDGLVVAEAGNAPLDAPTLVWFHADW